MFTYNLHWKSSKSILLYPKIDQQDSQFGKYYHNPIFEFENEFKPIKNFCKVGFISIIDGGNYRDTKSLSSAIIGKLYV